MGIYQATLTATASGAAGSATGEATTNITLRGYIEAVYVDENAAATTADVTLTTASTPTRTILDVSDVTADAWYIVREAVVDTDGSAITNGYDKIAINDTVTLSIAQANDGDTVTVTIQWSGE